MRKAPAIPAAGLLLCLLASACGEGSSFQGVERPTFNGKRAHAYVQQQVAFGPRDARRVPRGKQIPARPQQLRWMRTMLAARADTVFEQPFTHPRPTGGPDIALTNVVARFRPQETRRILLVTHWDTRGRADRSPIESHRTRSVPGANDGASGVAVLIELAELFRTQPPPVGVDLLFTDGAEIGSSSTAPGASHFLATRPAGYAPEYVIVLERVGDLDPRFPLGTQPTGVAARIYSLAQGLGHEASFPASAPPTLDHGDHLVLRTSGIPTILIADGEYGPGNAYWRTANDLPSNTQAESLAAVGEVIAELIYRGG